ncbi:hypothetical protein [Pseudomonas abieticivorans]|uniref:hypothetical protein n=1 Tax=Pseudomonas abieticivorans TaxID=2931382 RepID=UPI0032DE90F1
MILLLVASTSPSEHFLYAVYLYSKHIESHPLNFDQSKALRLQQWHSTLDDHDFRMQTPEAHRQTLHAMSAALLSEGLIDVLQQFDLNEMANAAYWHAVEELQSCPVHYCAASSYDVRGNNSELLGKIRRSIFYVADTLVSDTPSTYDGKVYRDSSGANLVFNPSGDIARIDGLTLTLREGEQYTLIETGRTIEGVTYEPMEDPDSYRGLMDAAQVAHECRDLDAFEKLRPLLDLARLRPCIVCQDRFDQREDCSVCVGLGFVTKSSAVGLP